MIDEKASRVLSEVSRREFERYRDFLSSHRKRLTEFRGKEIPYYSCGAGERVLLMFAGGWGGIELAYESILGFEGGNRVLVVDISGFDDPDEMSDGVNHVLDAEGAGRVVVVGQSFTGIIGQSYFVRQFRRVEGIVLTNTLSPKKERSRTWALFLLRVLPLGWLKPLIRRKVTRLGEFKEPLPPEIAERRRFAAALLGCMIDTYWAKKATMNVLKLVFAFNKQDEYSKDSFPGWKGKALVVTSPDDPYYPDAALILKNLPNAEKFEFPAGFGHTAPQIHRDRFHRIIQEFVDGLEGR
jgi:pimeloyl-ACP methyl ester carboxylesterase